MRAYTESCRASGFRRFTAEDVVLAILADVTAVITIPIQGPVGFAGNGGRNRRRVLVLALAHDLQVSPVAVLTLVVQLHAASHIARVRIVPTLRLAVVIVV